MGLPILSSRMAKRFAKYNQSTPFSCNLISRAPIKIRTKKKSIHLSRSLPLIASLKTHVLTRVVISQSVSHPPGLISASNFLLMKV